ncbi:MAG: response regulator transcription factor, partial [Firmicutes bacterium]|nr:response regulator transcription factor [Bacillota bacterium]
MERILIIEDEEKIARFIELELQFEGYEVEKAFEGRAGLALAQAQPFDLILLDIMLPGLNGIEVLRAETGIRHLNFMQLLYLMHPISCSDMLYLSIQNFYFFFPLFDRLIQI